MEHREQRGGLRLIVRQIPRWCSPPCRRLGCVTSTTVRRPTQGDGIGGSGLVPNRSGGRAASVSPGARSRFAVVRILSTSGQLLQLQPMAFHMLPGPGNLGCVMSGRQEWFVHLP